MKYQNNPGTQYSNECWHSGYTPKYLSPDGSNAVETKSGRTGCRRLDGIPRESLGMPEADIWGVRDSDAHPTQYTVRLGWGAGLPSSQHSFMNYCEAEASILGWWARFFR